jgi:hypothetical protein
MERKARLVALAAWLEGLALLAGVPVRAELGQGMDRIVETSAAAGTASSHGRVGKGTIGRPSPRASRSPLAGEGGPTGDDLPLGGGGGGPRPSASPVPSPPSGAAGSELERFTWARAMPRLS